MGYLKSVPVIHQKIHLMRGQKVMLDQDLAYLYGVSTKALIQGVKRNKNRFPVDFMFQLNTSEAKLMRSQFVTASKRNLRHRSYAFTEQGVAMLSSVLKSQRAILVNISIIRAFVKLREFLNTHKKLAKKLKNMEGKLGNNSKQLKTQAEQIKMIFQAINDLMEPKKIKKKQIGFNNSKSY